jgi:hypothetical protein
MVMQAKKFVRKLRPIEAAKLVGCGEKVIRAAIHKKELAHRRGNFQGEGQRDRYLIDEDDLMRWIDQRFPKVSGAGPAAPTQPRKKRPRGRPRLQEEDLI